MKIYAELGHVVNNKTWNPESGWRLTEHGKRCAAILSALDGVTPNQKPQ